MAERSAEAEARRVVDADVWDCLPSEWARWGVWRLDLHDDDEGGEA